MKHYITYDENKPQCIWGTGKSEKESHGDAIEQFGEIDIVPPTIALKTIECSSNVFEYVLDHGGYNVPWENIKGIAQLTDSQKISFTKKEVQAIRKALDILDSKLRK